MAPFQNRPVDNRPVHNRQPS